MQIKNFSNTYKIRFEKTILFKNREKAVNSL